MAQNSTVWRSKLEEMISWKKRKMVDRTCVDKKSDIVMTFLRGGLEGEGRALLSPVIGVAFCVFEMWGLCCLAWERRGGERCFLFALSTLSEPEFDASMRNGVYRQELSDGCGQWSDAKASVL